jgi:hypothetical protein
MKNHAKNFWYTSRYDEILIDLDGTAGDKLARCLARLRGSIEHQELPVKSVWLFPSFTDHHYHIIIRLIPGRGFSQWEKYAFQLYLFSDVFRTCCNLMRQANEHPFPDLLITIFSLKNEFGFYRLHDAACNCESKHSLEVLKDCSAAKLLRGSYRQRIYFSKPIEPNAFFKKRFGTIYERDTEL